MVSNLYIVTNIIKSYEIQNTSNKFDIYIKNYGIQ